MGRYWNVPFSDSDLPRKVENPFLFSSILYFFFSMLFIHSKQRLKVKVYIFLVLWALIPRESIHTVLLKFKGENIESFFSINIFAKNLTGRGCKNFHTDRKKNSRNVSNINKIGINDDAKRMNKYWWFGTSAAGKIDQRLAWSSGCEKYCITSHCAISLWEILAKSRYRGTRENPIKFYT